MSYTTYKHLLEPHKGDPQSGEGKNKPVAIFWGLTHSADKNGLPIMVKFRLGPYR